MKSYFQKILILCALTMLALNMAGCSNSKVVKPVTSQESTRSGRYLIGPGDVLQVFVWRNPEISVTIPVRPEGKISTPLVEDIVAVGKTPTQLARDIEKVLAKYIKSPIVTVIVQGFVGTFNEQVRVVGQALNPKALSYRNDMTLLDVMIEVGGLTEFAAGNKAKILRKRSGQEFQINVHLKDLLQKGDVSENIKMQPGDILIIPESWF